MPQEVRSMEETARKRNPMLGNITTGLSWVGIVASGLVAVMSLSSVTNMLTTGFNILPIILLVVFGGVAFLLWRNKDNMRVEYDYTFTPITPGTADLDVAKVFGNSRRRLMTSLSLKTAESAGPVGAPAFQRYLTMKDVKKHNWFVNRDAGLYYFYFTKNAVKHVIVLELSDAMVEQIKPFLNFGVWQKQ